MKATKKFVSRGRSRRKLDIGARMLEVINRIREGVNGVPVPDVAVEEEKSWSPDYAIVQDAYPDAMAQEEPYFDHDAFDEDFRAMVAGLFVEDGKAPVVIRGCNLKRQIDPGTIVVNFSGSEIEIYRASRFAAPSSNFPSGDEKKKKTRTKKKKKKKGSKKA